MVWQQQRRTVQLVMGGLKGKFEKMIHDFTEAIFAIIFQPSHDQFKI